MRVGQPVLFATRFGEIVWVIVAVHVQSLFAVVVTWYFRRGDKKYKKVIDSKRVNPFDDTLPPEPPA